MIRIGPTGKYVDVRDRDCRNWYDISLSACMKIIRFFGVVGKSMDELYFNKLNVHVRV